MDYGKRDLKKITDFNLFCKDLKEGQILYNLNATNKWGEYLMVANITLIKIFGMHTYTVLLIGMMKDGESYVPRNLRVNLTIDYIKDVQFLKYIGYCDFTLIPEYKHIEINKGLVAIYSTTDLRRYTHKLSVRKPKNRKYDKDGKLVIRKADNDKK